MKMINTKSMGYHSVVKVASFSYVITSLENAWYNLLSNCPVLYIEQLTEEEERLHQTEENLQQIEAKLKARQNELTSTR